VKLAGGIKKAGVFVNAEITEVIKTAENAGIDIIQFHGDEPESDIIKAKNVGFEVWKAVRIRDGHSSNIALKYLKTADFILADTYKEGVYGGVGESFDYSLIQNLPKNRLILAGGLTPENAAAAIKTARPYAVDVSGGVETAKIKDAEKIRKFISECRGLNNK
jgi:phosphoribosylanthranilate isomerase